jgi:hypothetical protein
MNLALGIVESLLILLALSDIGNSSALKYLIALYLVICVYHIFTLVNKVYKQNLNFGVIIYLYYSLLNRQRFIPYDETNCFYLEIIFIARILTETTRFIVDIARKGGLADYFRINKSKE